MAFDTSVLRRRMLIYPPISPTSGQALHLSWPASPLDVKTHASRKVPEVATNIISSPIFAIAVVGSACRHLIVYSQTLAYTFDEGFDIVAAQLIAAGRRPYIDFFYQHTPLFTYLTAGWMRLFGQNWQSVHLLPALLTCGGL